MKKNYTFLLEYDAVVEKGGKVVKSAQDVFLDAIIRATGDYEQARKALDYIAVKNPEAFSNISANTGKGSFARNYIRKLATERAMRGDTELANALNSVANAAESTSKQITSRAKTAVNSSVKRATKAAEDVGANRLSKIADPTEMTSRINSAKDKIAAEAEAAKNATGELRTSGQEVLKDIKKAQSRAADFMSRDAKIVSGDKIEKVINSKFNSLKKCNDPIRAKKLVNQIRRLAKRGNLEDSIQNLDSVYADVLKRLRNAHSTSGIAQVNARNALRGMIDGSETYQQMARTLKNRLTPLPPPPKPSWLSRVGQTIKGWLPKALKRTVR